MNGMPVLFAQPWVEHLGWTLIHFVWQGFWIAILYAAARRLMRGSSPNARYLLACATLAALTAAPLVTWQSIQTPRAVSDIAFQIATAPTTPLAGSATETSPVHSAVRTTAFAAPAPRFLMYVVTIWLAGTLMFWVRLLGGCVVAARMRSAHVRSAPAEWQEALRKLGARIGLSHPVRLLVSALVQAPTVIGWLRPVVLVPVGALSGLPAGHLEALLLHELAHIRRRDYLVNMLQGLAEALLFYHPAVWWVSGHIRAERELCCDDVAVAATGDRLAYACALAQLEFSRTGPVNAAIAANSGSLSLRIARLLHQPRPTLPTSLGPGFLAVVVLLVAAAYGLFGQPEARPSFQSVSIHRNTSDWSARQRHAMGMGANSSLLLMIRFAYATHGRNWFPLPTSQVSGGPEWIDSEGYDIDARPSAGADPNRTWLMWQTLLAERFKLRLHRETRELPVYVLSPAETGVKLPAPTEVACISFPPGTQPRQVPGKVNCGHINGPFASNRYVTDLLLHTEGSKVRMETFARYLALILDRPVLNKTGFAGEFDLDLNFAGTAALKGLPAGYGAQAEPNGPDIFAALPEQLGLKLTAATSPTEVLVIDHAERPALR